MIYAVDKMADKSSRYVYLFLVICLAILLRWCVSLFPYSGQNRPPMFGDYEAQRHWMEITVNLPAKDWYFNTSDNDLQYWGLDYPPLTAYHSLVCGYVSRCLNHSFVALNTSRGYESYEHKLFMRATVLFADLLVYIPAICWFFWAKEVSLQSVVFNTYESEIQTNNGVVAAVYLALIYPGLILIDHGHFQYNGVSLGFAVAAVAALFRNKILISAVMFCLALNYKQMELYHSLPFFCYMLGLCLSTGNKTLGVQKLMAISFVVISTFLVIWIPFLTDIKTVLQVIHRLFPLDRGVFEDKVANVWCSINIIYKFRNSLSNKLMARICFAVTVVSVLPSSIDLLLKPNKRKFVLALINSSLAFFLFSFQVHEKSILLAAIPAVLYFPFEAYSTFWFLLLCTFSMLPLLLKDGLLIPYIALTVIYLMSVHVLIDIDMSTTGWILKSDKPLKQGTILRKNLHSSVIKLGNISVNRRNLISLLFNSSLTGCVILMLLSVSVKPPTKYPDLFPLLVSVYSCGHFLCFFIYFNYRQIFSNTLHEKCT